MNRQALLKYSLVCVLLFLLLSCEGQGVPNSRNFCMGFTSYPYDVNPADTAAVEYTSQKINQYGDLLAFHFDNGLPWDEALADDGSHKNYPSAIMNDLASKKAQILSGHKIYVGLSVLNSTRTALAGYRNNSGDSQVLPSLWSGYSFDEVKVLTAYVNYCELLIDSLAPDYFNYGIEGNSKNWVPSEYAKYVLFCSSVYSALRAKYPELKLMVSCMIDDDQKSFANAQALMPYSDYLGVSIYPFMYLGAVTIQSGVYVGDANPAQFPADWLSKIQAIAPSKKIAIAETGYLAETLDLSATAYPLKKYASAKWQADYVEKLMISCQSLSAEFVVYWEIRDYDKGWAFLNSLGVNDPLLALWKDIGLIDGDGNPRPALTVWNSWLSKKRQ